MGRIGNLGEERRGCSRNDTQSEAYQEASSDELNVLILTVSVRFEVPSFVIVVF